jgi:hypothetical protein
MVEHVPGGDPVIIARRFIAGFPSSNFSSPVGTAEINQRHGQLLHQLSRPLHFQHQTTATSHHTRNQTATLGLTWRHRPRKKMKAVAVGGTDDHVHILLSLPATITLAKAAQLIKGGGSHLIWFFKGFRALQGRIWHEIQFYGFGGLKIGAVDTNNLLESCCFRNDFGKMHSRKFTAQNGKSLAFAVMHIIPLIGMNVWILFKWIDGVTIPSPPSNGKGDRITHTCIELVSTNPDAYFITEKLGSICSTGIHPLSGTHSQSFGTKIPISTFSAVDAESFWASIFNDRFDCESSIGTYRNPRAAWNSLAFFTIKRSLVSPILFESGVDMKNVKWECGSIIGREFSQTMPATGIREINQRASAFHLLFKKENTTPCAITKLIARRQSFPKL